MRFLATPLLVNSCLAAPLAADSLWMGETVVPVTEAILTNVQHFGPVNDVGLLVRTGAGLVGRAWLGDGGQHNLQVSLHELLQG